MKPLSKLTFALLLSLATLAGYSQAAKPQIFSNFPSTINCSVSEFHNAFSASEGQHIILTFSNNFKFSGTVLSNEMKYSNLQSVVIRSDESEKTVFHLSKQLNSDNTVSYVGRIMNPGASDGYQVKNDQEGNYKFEKIDAEKILLECNLN
jgi:hypothetical protein